MINVRQLPLECDTSYYVLDQ